jgi:hypothetical protein
MFCLVLPGLLNASGIDCYRLPLELGERCETEIHNGMCTPDDIDPFDFYCTGAGIQDGWLEDTCSDFCGGSGNVNWNASWCDSGAAYPLGLDMMCVSDFYIHCECTEV